MEHGYSALMLFICVILLVYALLIALLKSPDLLPRVYAAKRKPRKYSMAFAKLIALLSLAPALSGLMGLISPTLPCVLILIVAFIFFLRLGIQLFMPRR